MTLSLTRAGCCILTMFISLSASAMDRGRAEAAGAIGGCPGAESCFEEHSSIGCDNTECCTLVCDLDPFCCNNSWDGICVDEAFDLCTCGGELTESCFESHDAPHCNDEECCEAVCAIDSYCCEVSWDSICVGEAEDLCTCGGELTESCFETHALPHCNDEECCEAVCAIDSYCCEVSWDSICVGEAEDLCTCGGDLVGSCFETHDLPHCNDEACCEAVCAIDSFCCDSSWDSICVDEANDLCLGCGGVSSGSCLETHGNPACNDQECCDAVCAIDSFCCEVSWDSLCVDEATDLCTCGGELTGSCFDTHGLPKCNNGDCCAAVCAVDSFCCEVSWDSICVGEAEDLCLGCGGPGSGSCFATDNTPGCNDQACCAAVCAADPFCCNTAWDSLCVDGANNLCNSCPADLNNSGSVDGADLGLLLGAWDTAGPGDINGSGSVDGGDLGLLLGAWGDC